MGKKQEPSICCLQEIHLAMKGKNCIHLKECKKKKKLILFQARGNRRQSAVDFIIFNRIDFKPKLVIRGNSEGIVVLNIYVPNKDRRAPRASPELCSAVVSS
jgi:hypothetical protein